jgi:hypothetical protein
VEVAPDSDRLRPLLLALLVLSMLGTAAELLLLGHFEKLAQRVPLATLGVGVLCSGAVLLRPGRRVLRLFQIVMALCVAAGLLGVSLHLQGNAEFERERSPSLQGVGLVWKSMRGATPALAPLAMAQLGLLGLAATYRHPLLRRHPAAQHRVENQ